MRAEEEVERREKEARESAGIDRVLVGARKGFVTRGTRS